MHVRRVVSGLLAVMVAGLAFSISDPEPAAGTNGGERANASDASAEARRLGHRVEVLNDLDEARDVYAEPDGSFTSVLHTVPVRARKDGRWVPIDATLSRQADGSVAPAATTRSVVFSGGGDQPLVTVAKDGHRVILRWPGRLPVPSLSGDTATYPDVFPGVDLRMKATADGFAKVLVVKNRDAADRLTEIRFPVTTDGLSARTDDHGAIGFADAAGKQVFGTGAPMMWDSGGRRTTGGLRLDDDALVLRPNRALLTDPAAVFPVYLDPDFPAGGAGWALVFSGAAYAGQSFWGGDGDGIAKVGQCPTSLDGFCNGIGDARSYFQFSTGFLVGRHILGAEFNALETWSASCTAKPVQAWGTDTVGTGTTWSNQPWWPGTGIALGTRTVAYGRSGCPADWVGWDAAPIVNWSVGLGKTATTIMLRAENEADDYGWKKFATNPTLTVHYNSYPNAPSLPTVEGKPCAGQPNEPYVNPYVDNDPAKGSRGPELASVISDYDGGNVIGGFEWYTRDHVRLGGVNTAAKGSGSTFRASIPAQYATDGAKLSYRSIGYDGVDWGPWSAYCDVTIDRTAPATLPGVSSTTYPECAPPDYDPCPTGGGIGRTGAFTLTANGTADVAGFRYDLHDQPATYVAAVNGVAQGLVTPPEDGPMDLYARSVDRAGNVGPIQRYHFIVGAGSPPVSRWRMEGLREPEVRDEQRHHDGTTVIGPAEWRAGRLGDALWLDGTADAAVVTGKGPAVDTSRTFSVSAWAWLDHVGGYPAVVSEDGVQSPGFQLQATPSGNWAFAMFAADVAGGGSVHSRIVSATPATTGAWTHLVGVYDAGRSEMRLYVNGALAATGAKAAGWRATGPLTIGRSRWNGAPSDFWTGGVDEVRAYDRALSVEEIHDLAGLPATEELFLPLDDGARDGADTPTALDMSGIYRPAVVEGAATWTTGRVGDGALRLDGTTGAARTTGPVVRTDNSFTVTAWALLDAADGRTQTVLSQDGVQYSGFVLRYRNGTWSFGLNQSATDAGQAATVNAADGAFDGEWTHLAAVYDAGSRKIRLYVNGALAGPEVTAYSGWNAAGPFRVGRDQTTAAMFAGVVDDVHVWSGVRTGDEIRNEYLKPATRRVPLYGGDQLSRYVSADGHHIVTTERVPNGYHFERGLGLTAPIGTPGTRVVYACRLGADDYFLATVATCEGFTKLGTAGAFYVNPPADGAMPVYRCNIPGHSHFASPDPACEGRTTEGLLGYTRAYGYLVRSYSSPDGDHLSSNFITGAQYRAEGSLGLVALTSRSGATALWTCRTGTETFSSTQADCEGATVVRWTGYVWTTPPEGTSAAELFRCRTAAGDRFDSRDPGCERQTFDRSLGYLLNRV